MLICPLPQGGEPILPSWAAMVAVALLAEPAGAPAEATSTPAPSVAATPGPSPPATEGAASASGPWQDDPGLLREPEPGLAGTVVIVDGTTYDGRIESIDQGKVAVWIDAETSVVTSVRRVRGVIEEETLPHGSQARRGGPEVRLVLADGSVVGGCLVESGRGRMTLESPGIGRREFEASQVKRVIRFPEAARPVEARARYLEAPSAFLLRPGEIHVASTDVVHLAAMVGATEFLTVSVGSVVPALRARAYESNLQGTVRAGLALAEWLRIAGGAHLTVSGGGKAAGYLSATATYGAPAAHVTLHAGPMFPGANLLGEFGDLGLALCGSLTVAPWVDVVSENWVSRSQGDTNALLALAGRLRTGRAAFDVGASLAAREATVRPWLGITVDVTP